VDGYRTFKARRRSQKRESERSVRNNANSFRAKVVKAISSAA
jgi:hypothetical protein